MSAQPQPATPVEKLPSIVRGRYGLVDEQSTLVAKMDAIFFLNGDQGLNAEQMTAALLARDWLPPQLTVRGVHAAMLEQYPRGRR
jgi:hypothetical protein